MVERPALVVISFFDERATGPLQRLLASLRQHAAGAPFDICVVVNRGRLGRPDLKFLPPGARVAERENVGMNIGAWDHGWRANPAYGDFLFLQDDCVVLRRGWLAAFRSRAKDARIGLLGESMNIAWNKPWIQLRAEQDNVRMPGHDMAGRPANRVDLYLEFLERNRIEPGNTATHLRSLVWYAARSVLERIGGFPIGQTYGECIAAEIAVSKRVEAAGLRAEQVHRKPFRYIGHEEWSRSDHPGGVNKVTATSYAGQLAFAEQLLERVVLLSEPGRTVSALKEKLLRERRMMVEGWIPGEAVPAVTLILDLRFGWQTADTEKTLRSWEMQSHPECDCVIVGGNLERPPEWQGALRCAAGDDWQSLKIPLDRYLVFARPGDLLHPSLAFSIALRAQERKADVLVWNSVLGSESGARLLVQRPRLERFTLLNHDYIGRDLAVRAALVDDFSRSVDGSSPSLLSLPFKQWLAWHGEAQWHTQAEVLAWRLDQADSAGHAAAIAETELCVGTPECEVRQFTDRGAFLWPARTAAKVSVIIPYRGFPEGTLRAVRSVERQKSSAAIEIILIDNDSDRDSRAQVDRGVSSLREGVAARVIDYPHPFNHSRQCNIGAKAATGDVVVFMNNDAVMLTDDVLEGLMRWALLDKVASVGCRLVGEDGQLISAGIVARKEVGSVQSPVQESRDEILSRCVREVTGNTFALSAVRRDTFFGLGALDELMFPVGYNDVDYCLRASDQGYCHLFLGSVEARHQPGTSRGKVDESLQKLFIRERYPSVMIRGLFEWSIVPAAEEVKRPLSPRIMASIKRLSRQLRR